MAYRQRPLVQTLSTGEPDRRSVLEGSCIRQSLYAFIQVFEHAVWCATTALHSWGQELFTSLRVKFSSCLSQCTSRSSKKLSYLLAAASTKV